MKLHCLWLEPGRYFFWKNGHDIAWTSCDLRIRQMDVAGQEILTLDKVALRINFVCTYRVLDPVRLYREQEDPERQLYTALQLALREVVGHLRFDELLERRHDLGSLVLEALPNDGAVEFVSAGRRGRPAGGLAQLTRTSKTSWALPMARLMRPATSAILSPNHASSLGPSWGVPSPRRVQSASPVSCLNSSRSLSENDPESQWISVRMMPLMRLP